MNQLAAPGVIAPIRGGEGDPVWALATAATHAPYLARLQHNHQDALARLRQGEAPEAVFASALADMKAAAAIAGPFDAPMAAMRRAKEVGHMVAAAADLSGVWGLDKVVGSLSELADESVRSALALAIRASWAGGRFGEKVEREDLPGFFALAMGKMGAHELNYSSDIDLILLFDLDIVPVDPNRVKEGMTRMTRDIVRILEERTADGYVFRTDLRLRPDPASTAPAVSTQFAAGYYESVGQNWERMAHIKARVCAGDAAAGRDYLEQLVPYVWRRHLDYWAIADIHSIKRQIHSHGGHAALAAADFDVKLGRGGIREIEFFAQVQQLILGGRFPALRAPRTKAALAAMEEAGVVTPEVSANLHQAYDFLRGLEHRIQMVHDEQTHRLPDIPDKRRQVAVLAGFEEQPVFETAVASTRTGVHNIYSDLFAQEERLSGFEGNLVFTGVDDDPGTVATLKGMGFGNPSRIIAAFQAWHRGGVPATRSARGRQILTALAPRLLTTISECGAPDAAFERFSDFFGGLTAGVQTMSLMLAEPSLSRDIIETMAFAPKLASDLARRPALLEAMMEPRFRVAVNEDPPGDRAARLRVQIDRADGFEAQINAARRFHREEAFRIGYQLLRGGVDAEAAGQAYADLADACVAEMARVAEADVRTRFEGEIGKWAVCALGKFGGRELTATSDLDLMLVYEPEGENATMMATRFVQRLIAALSAPTEEGALYEVDMQLRPSGRAGPVAVQFSSFEAYYRGEAWTWEFMALTRLRPVAGDPGLCARLAAAACAALRAKSGDPKVTADAADMRRRMARERPAKSHWDLKLAPGGLVDLEFVIQHEILLAAGQSPQVVQPSSLQALEELVRVGRIEAGAADTLAQALRFLLDLQQVVRIAVGDKFEPATAPEGLAGWLAHWMGEDGFAALDAKLLSIQAAVAAIRQQKLGPLSTD